MLILARPSAFNIRIFPATTKIHIKLFSAGSQTYDTDKKNVRRDILKCCVVFVKSCFLLMLHTMAHYFRSFKIWKVERKKRNKRGTVSFNAQDTFRAQNLESRRKTCLQPLFRQKKLKRTKKMCNCVQHQQKTTFTENSVLNQKGAPNVFSIRSVSLRIRRKKFELSFRCCWKNTNVDGTLERQNQHLFSDLQLHCCGGKWNSLTKHTY